MDDLNGTFGDDQDSIKNRVGQQQIAFDKPEESCLIFFDYVSDLQSIIEPFAAK